MIDMQYIARELDKLHIPYELARDDEVLWCPVYCPRPASEDEKVFVIELMNHKHYYSYQADWKIDDVYEEWHNTFSKHEVLSALINFYYQCYD